MIRFSNAPSPVAPSPPPLLLADPPLDYELDTCDAGANRLPRLVDQSAGVIVEFDRCTVWSLVFFGSANNDSMSYVAPSHLVCSSRGIAAHSTVPDRAGLLHHHYNAIA